MEHHADLGADVHTTDELTELLGATVVERRHVHGWPLSLVEELRTDAGDRWIYKAQRLLPVEAAFYRAAAGRTELLPACQVLTDDGTSSTLLLEHLGSPVSVEGMGEADVVALCRSVVDAIGTLPDGLPHHLDWGSATSFRRVADWVIDELAALVAAGTFVHASADDVELLRAWSRSQPVTDAVEAPTRLTCCDIKLDQVFPTSSATGFKVIDWQVSVVGPANLDLVGLLLSAGVDPFDHVDAAVFGLWWFRLVHWAVLAKLELLPEITELFDTWAALGIGNVRRSATTVE
jgi:hypothetical protein